MEKGLKSITDIKHANKIKHISSFVDAKPDDNKAFLINDDNDTRESLNTSSTDTSFQSNQAASSKSKPNTNSIGLSTFNEKNTLILSLILIVVIFTILILGIE